LAIFNVYPGTTIQSVVDSSAPGDTIVVHAGTYVEQVTIQSSRILIGSGATIDGSGNRAAIIVDGATDILIQGFKITNATGSPSWSGVVGIVIQDRGNVSGIGSQRVQIRNCDFYGIKRKAAVAGSYAVSITVSSYAHDGATNCKNIQIVENIFRDIEGYTDTGLYLGTVSILGNIEEVLVDKNYFYQSSRGNNGIEFSGNYNSPANPDRVRNAVISNNVFRYTGPTTVFGLSIYVQGGDNILVERNDIDWPLGLVVVCEEGSGLTNTKNITLRRNKVNVLYDAAIVGTWDSTYLPVDNICFDSNTLYAKNGDTLMLIAGDGIGGTYIKIVNNIINGSTYNAISSALLSNNSYNLLEPRLEDRYDIVDRSYGEYTPTTYKDLNGSTQKACRGAIEKTWMVVHRNKFGKRL